MVVYIRRTEHDEQISGWLIGRNHFTKATHLIQNYLVGNLKDSSSLDELVDRFFTSCRSLTRLFKAEYVLISQMG